MIAILLSTSCDAQIKNSKTETVKIYGNCGMCEKTIEKAGYLKKVAKVDWDKDTKMATITYDTKKTSQAEILKRIALAGYDSDIFLAPDDIYAKLPGCCQYDRVRKTANIAEKSAIEPIIDRSQDHANHQQTNQTEAKTVDHSAHTEAKSNQTSTSSAGQSDKNHKSTTPVVKPEISHLTAVFDHYFAVKDALVKTDGNTASAKAKELLKAINAVKMGQLANDEHVVWMKVMKDLALDAEHIGDTKETSHQRDHFINLSTNMYDLIKVSKHDAPIYYQHCPMANNGKGANWLSKENKVQNPYYGSVMLTCGKVVETIK
jgi:copper chaperone CopZ